MSAFSFDFFPEALEASSDADPAPALVVPEQAIPPPEAEAEEVAPPAPAPIPIPPPPLPLPTGLPYRVVGESTFPSLKVVIPRGWKVSREEMRRRAGGEDDDSDSSSSSSDDEDDEDEERYNTDLIDGIYEGGLKTWEGSLDLVGFIDKCLDGSGDIEKNGKNGDGDNGNKNCEEKAMEMVRQLIASPPKSILELGCGSALPTIYLLRRFLKNKNKNKNKKENEGDEKMPKFTAIDYNDTVLSNSTWPNIFLNCFVDYEKNGGDAETIKSLVTCLAGDWNGLNVGVGSCGGDDVVNTSIRTDSRVGANCFDIVMASETCYTPKATWDTVRISASAIEARGGIAIILTKRFYFGVSGNASGPGKKVTGGGSAGIEQAVGVIEGVEILGREIVGGEEGGGGNLREVFVIGSRSKL